MFVYCASSKKLNEVQKKILYEEFNKVYTYFEVLLEAGVGGGKRLTVFLLDAHVKDTTRRAELCKKIFFIKELEIDENLSFEENIKIMKVAFTEAYICLKELELIIKKNNKIEKARVVSEKEKENARVVSEKEKEQARVVSEKEKEQDKKFLEDTYGEFFLFKNAKIQNKEVLGFIELTKESKEILDRIEVEIQQEETNNKCLIFITLAATCALLLFFLIKHLSSKGKNES